MSEITSTQTLGGLENPEEDNLDNFTLAELQDLAEMKGIPDYGKLGKEVLKAAIRNVKSDVSRETIPIVEEKEEVSQEEIPMEEEDAS